MLFRILFCLFLTLHSGLADKTVEERLLVLEQDNERLSVDNEELKTRISNVESKVQVLTEQCHGGNEALVEGGEATTEEPIDDLEERVAKLEELGKINVLRTCDEYLEYGFNNSDIYSIDPDGKGIGAPPVNAFCDFDRGSTEILHDAESRVEVTHCNTPDCHYEMKVNYSASMEQMIALIDLSKNCEQDIQFDCLLAPLQDDGEPIGFWLNRNGDPETYFDGANHGTHMCQCSVTNSCFHPDDKCNCDAQVPEELADSGTITDSGALPITGFQYGRLEYEIERAYIRFGRLRCFGKAELSDEEVGSSCKALKLRGETQSGFYEVMRDRSTKIVTTAFCNFDVGLNDPAMQTDVGDSDLRETIYFEANVPMSNTYLPSGVITYSEVTLNLGGGMDPSSGKFTAPRDGKYYFAVTGERQEDFFYIHVYVNGVNVQIDTHQSDIDRPRSSTFFAIFELQKGDQVWLDVNEANSIHLLRTPFRFMGYILPEF